MINSDYQDGMKRHFQDVIDGKSIFIKNPIEGLENAYNLHQSRFTLIGSSSGAGKSYFLDKQYVLAPWEFIKTNPDVHFEVLYYSQERKMLFKHYRWVSYFLQRDKNWLIPASTLMGEDPRGIPGPDVIKMVNSYDKEMSDLLDVVQVRDGRVGVDRVAEDIRKKMQQLGTLYISDDIGVTKAGEDEYLDYFDEDRYRDTRIGREQYVNLEHKGEMFTMTPNNKKYFLNNSQTFVFIAFDGIGLVDKRPGQSTKAAVDEMTDLLADSRDVYGTSPIVVSQFNRSIADIHRQKAHGADLTPQEGDFRDSAGPYQAADLVLGLFDPVRFKAYDDDGIYKGYDVQAGMVSPRGVARFRSLHVLKNTFGIDGLGFGLKFTGESGNFEKLPAPDSEAIKDVYSLIAQNK